MLIFIPLCSFYLVFTISFFLISLIHLLLTFFFFFFTLCSFSHLIPKLSSKTIVIFTRGADPGQFDPDPRSQLDPDQSGSGIPEEILLKELTLMSDLV